MEENMTYKAAFEELNDICKAIELESFSVDESPDLEIQKKRLITSLAELRNSPLFPNCFLVRKKVDFCKQSSMEMM
jgi:hypothetical protein